MNHRPFGQHTQLLVDLLQRQEANLPVALFPPGHSIDGVQEPPVGRPETVLSNRVREHHMQDLADPVRGLRRDPVSLNPLGDMRLNHPGTEFFKNPDLNMAAGKPVLDRDRFLGLVPVIHRAARLEGLAQRAEHRPQVGQVVLVGLSGSDRSQVLTERAEERDDRRVGSLLELARDKVPLKLFQLAAGDPLVAGPQRVPDAFAVHVVANPLGLLTGFAEDGCHRRASMATPDPAPLAMGTFWSPPAQKKTQGQEPTS